VSYIQSLVIQSLAGSPLWLPNDFLWLPWLVNGWLFWLVLRPSVVMFDHFVDQPLPAHTQVTNPHIPQSIFSFSQHKTIPTTMR